VQILVLVGSYLTAAYLGSVHSGWKKIVYSCFVFSVFTKLKQFWFLKIALTLFNLKKLMI